MQIKKIFNLEEDLTSDEFIATKQDMISEQCQDAHPDFLCKITTYCTADKKFVIHTTEENKTALGAVERMLAHRPMAEQSLLTLDNEMTNTWEINITADTDLPDYVTALDVAQAKVDAMFDEDKTTLPIVTVVDYRWGNPTTQMLPTVFGDVDADGNLISATQPSINISIGDRTKGEKYKAPQKTVVSSVYPTNIDLVDVRQLKSITLHIEEINSIYYKSTAGRLFGIPDRRGDISGSYFVTLTPKYYFGNNSITSSKELSSGDKYKIEFKKNEDGGVVGVDMLINDEIVGTVDTTYSLGNLTDTLTIGTMYKGGSIHGRYASTEYIKISDVVVEYD